MRNKVEITGVNTLELKVMPQEETMELIKLSQNGDYEARDRIVEGNIKLVLSVIKKFNNRGVDLDDLFQVGAMGLIKAVDNFDWYEMPGNIKRASNTKQLVLPFKFNETRLFRLVK